MTIEDVKTRIQEQAQTKEEQIRSLRKIRCQQLLDQVDYLIYELKKGGI